MSDAFAHKVEKPEIELTCRVYNLNKGHNQKLLEACPFLKEYMLFVDYVRAYHAEQEYENLELAINLAIDRCIMENVLRDFLKEHRSEVVKVTQLDYTFDRQIELEREDAKREGIEQGIERGIGLGIEQGRMDEVYSSVQEGDYGIERGAKKLNMSVIEFEKKMQEAGYKIPEIAE